MAQCETCGHKTCVAAGKIREIWCEDWEAKVVNNGCESCHNIFCADAGKKGKEPTCFGAWKSKPLEQGIIEAAIKDSGNRTEFPSGAVRDMHIGKGRMDLLPWSAIIQLSKHCERGALKYGERNIDKGLPIHSLMDSAFRHMAKYMEGAIDEDHLLAALWNLAWAVQFEVDMPEMQDIPARMEDTAK